MDAAEDGVAVRRSRRGARDAPRDAVRQPVAVRDVALARQEHEPAVPRLLRVVVPRGGVGHVLVAEVLDRRQALGVDARPVEALDAARRVVVADAALGQEPVWKSTSASGAFLGDDVAALAPSSGEEPTSPRYRAGVASMAWRSTR